MNDWESRYVGVNGITLHVVTAGPEAGPLVILLHGFPEHFYSWRKQIPVLADAGLRVVVPDQRGYNLSDKPPRVRDYRLDELTQDIVSLIDALERENAAMVGHDWGGGVAHRLAMDYAERVRKLVILNSPHPRAMAREARKPQQFLRSLYMLYFQVPWLPETLFNRFPLPWARFFFRGTAVNQQAFTDADLLRMAEANARPGAMRAMINWYRAAARFPPLRHTRRITAPTRIIWAEDDVALNRSLTEGIQGWYGEDFRIDYIPHCGHWVQNEAPEQVNRLLVEFLAGE